MKDRNRSKLLKKISSFTDDSFLEEAQEIYNDAHYALMQRDKEKLLEFVTEHAFSVKKTRF